jgi:hypothetical protein
MALLSSKHTLQIEYHESPVFMRVKHKSRGVPLKSVKEPGGQTWKSPVMTRAKHKSRGTIAFLVYVQIDLVFSLSFDVNGYVDTH